MQNTHILVVKKTSGIHSVEDMTGKVLGAQNGSSGMLDFEEHPEVLKNRVQRRDADQYQSVNEAIIDLKNDQYRRLTHRPVYADYYLHNRRHCRRVRHHSFQGSRVSPLR